MDGMHMLTIFSSLLAAIGIMWAASIHARAASLSAMVQTLQEEVKTLRQENDALRKRIYELERENQELHAEIRRILNGQTQTTRVRSRARKSSGHKEDPT
jgi:uncharacterized coiled-coil DUF342 family protein